MNSGCCAGPRFQAGTVPPHSPVASRPVRSVTHRFSGHRVSQGTLQQTGKQFNFGFGCSPRDSSGASLLGASGVACGVQDSVVEGEFLVSSCARVLDDASGAHANVDGELPQRNAEGVDCVSRALPVVSSAGGLGPVPAVSTAVAPSGTRLLRVLGWRTLFSSRALVQASLPAAQVLSA